MPQDVTTVFSQLGLSLGLGLLVGLQRQRSESRLAGFRTFPLITALGTITALLADVHGGWIVGLGLVALAVLALGSNLVKLQSGEADPGVTTEIAMLLMYGIGAYLVIGHAAVAIVLGGGVAVLLQLKEPMHRLAHQIGDDDFRAITQFILISLVVLPILPDRAFGPYDVLNPHEIWWMVVLIVGISLAGYLSYKLFGERSGTLLSGLLGGVISSTATTVSYARLSRAGGSRRLASSVILIASAVVFVRVLIEIAVVAPEHLLAAGAPIAVFLVVMAILAAVDGWSGKAKDSTMPLQHNPSELRSALVFAGLYALVLFAVAAAKEHFGSGGLYVVAVLSGLTDMDAITLSTAQLMQSDRLPIATGWRLILLASLSNLLFKLAMVGALGDRGLLLRLAGFFAIAIGVGVVILLAWPA